MITPIAATAGRRRRAARAAAVTLTAAGLLAAAGCGTAQVSSTAAGTANGGTATTPAAGGSASAAPSSSATAPGAPASSGAASGGPVAGPAPVPTVSGGPAASGSPACSGWPAKAPTASLPVSFVPVSVERCVNGATTIKGKGLWVTATLQRADGDLTALINALHQPAGTHRPGTVCPALAMIPPAIVLISGTGKQLIPRLPSSGCGITQSQVLVALNALAWHPVSVRLIAPVGDGTSPTVSGSPRTYQTAGSVAQ
jgi:hypothetical protein